MKIVLKGTDTTDNSKEKAMSLYVYSSPGLEPLLVTKCSEKPSKPNQFNE